MSELSFTWLGDTLVPYHHGWDLQKRLHEARVADRIPDTVLLLQHEPVYTAGKRTSQGDRPREDAGAPVYDIDRGGKITWHGPGQLTVYPIVMLPEPIDVVNYIRLLEEAILRTIAEFGLIGTRIEGRTGVWLDAAPERELPERKIAAIGCRIARGVGMHGYALNCDNDVSWFERIVPCGIADAGVTTLSLELGRSVPVTEVVPLTERHLSDVLGATGYHRTEPAPGFGEPETAELAEA